MVSWPDISLKQVLKDPILLQSFEKFLIDNWSQENLLFIEAIYQLKHSDSDTNEIRFALTRIYNTFIAIGAPLELNVKTQSAVKKRLSDIEETEITKKEAVNIMKETEDEILVLLKGKLLDFLRTPLAPVSTKNCHLYREPTIHQKRVVIIGGGFTGFTVASILDPMPLFHVTLIDTKDSFEYTPGIVTKLIHPDNPESLRFKHELYIKNGRVVIGYAEEILDDAHYVRINGEDIYFDYLVLSVGSSYSGQLKSSDASSIYRASGLTYISADIFKAEKILIIGGGLVGCELAAAIGQNTFPGSYPKKKVILAETLSKIIPRGTEKQRKKAESYLTSLGVEIIKNESIRPVNEDIDGLYQGTSGSYYSSKKYCILKATGSKINTDFIRQNSSTSTWLDENGYIKVKPTLQLDHGDHSNHIFAGGDATNVVEEKTAYAATIAGVCIARNICRLEKGKRPHEQGKSGLLAPPSKPLHGISSQGGIGKRQLSSLEKRLSILNPKWAILKLFNEKEFFKIVQKKSLHNNFLFGKLPKPLSIKITTNEKEDTRLKRLISSLSNTPKETFHPHSIHNSNSTDADLSYHDHNRVY
ncbi:FAD/NAD(P)-binding domain-containing protein [Backusella circina FSU 941]|nr:FAD/NAD(P)-binding domain-containing protein [Backusella circina FSU 941]